MIFPNMEAFPCPTHKSIRRAWLGVGFLALSLGSSASAQAPVWLSITSEDQILVELAPEDTSPANLFDLNGRTLVFTPDGDGRYSRSVKPVAWEENIGQTVADGAEIDLGSFRFDFAGRSWDSFFVNWHGLITFGEPLTYSYYDVGNRHAPMREVFASFVTAPTISPLYKPTLDGTPHIARWPDRVVVTWIAAEPQFYVHGVPPTEPSRFQVVLNADGGIAFNYRGVALGDGIAGLFPNEDVAKGDLIASIVDVRDSELRGHLDLLEAALYATTTDSKVILEFTVRSSIPDPGEGTRYSYRLYFDTDRPWWTSADWDDEDFTWQIDIRSGGERTAWGPGVSRLLNTDADNRIALLADMDGFQGIPAAVIVDAVEFHDDRFVQNNLVLPPAQIEFPVIPAVDLSQPDSRFSGKQDEVFHYRSHPDPVEIACRVIGAEGDEFDLFVFHNEFRVDSQEPLTPVLPHYGTAGREGTGIDWSAGVPCGEGRLKAVWVQPVWMKSSAVLNRRVRGGNRSGFESGLLLFAHEFTHVWTAHASYERNGKREPLFGKYCGCHWRPELHAAAAFPWDPTSAGPVSLMSELQGGFWRENADGTFTPISDYWGGGHSWLDLYLMGLADADEVPDMFILRNLQPVLGSDRYTGQKEIVSIEQVIAAEGPRNPPAARAQKVFNVGFIYLLEPGKTPDGDLLDLHAEYRDKVVEHWSHITGGRSQITTVIPSRQGRRPARHRECGPGSACGSNARRPGAGRSR